MASIGGEWYIGPGDGYPADPAVNRFVYATQPSGERYIVAKVWADEGDYESTAKLIAAAPRMLALLKRAEREWAMGIDAAHDWLQDARATYLEAEGKVSDDQ